MTHEKSGNYALLLLNEYPTTSNERIQSLVTQAPCFYEDRKIYDKHYYYEGKYYGYEVDHDKMHELHKDDKHNEHASDSLPDPHKINDAKKEGHGDQAKDNPYKKADAKDKDGDDEKDKDGEDKHEKEGHKDKKEEKKAYIFAYERELPAYEKNR